MKDDILPLFYYFKEYPDENADCLSWTVDLSNGTSGGG